jgi:hypothetical protein
VVGIAQSVRGRRPVAAAAAIVVLMWMGHAGIDWDWEMPAVTLPAFILAGTCAARRGRRAKRSAPSANTTWLKRLRGPVIALGCVLLAVMPTRTALSQARLDRAVDAYDRGNCLIASDRARAGHSALRARPEPSIVLGLCAARAGNRPAAVRAIDEAIGHDPGAWENYYALALVTGATGGDPRPALREARRRSPLDPRLTELARQLRTQPRRRWPAVCRDFRPWVDGFEREPIGG